MYNGEVQVFQDELDRFLSIAERFKLQGLITGFGGSHEDSTKKGTVEDQSDTKEDIHSQVNNTTLMETSSLEKMTQNVRKLEKSH